MTTDNTDMTSAIDQDQAQLDSVQEGSPQTEDSPLTGELRQLKELVENQNRQIAGLQSKQDRALNAIRRDAEDSARRQSEQAAQRYIQDLPEEHQGAFNSMLQANQAYHQENQRLREQQEVGQDPQEQVQYAQPQDEWDQVYAIPRSLGIDPQSPGIDYKAFTDPGLDETQRRDRFFASLKPLMGATNQASTGQASQASTSQIQSPPTSGTPASGASSYMRSLDQVQAAYIEGRLSKQEYQDQLNRFGQ